MMMMKIMITAMATNTILPNPGSFKLQSSQRRLPSGRVAVGAGRAAQPLRHHQDPAGGWSPDQGSQGVRGSDRGSHPGELSWDVKPVQGIGQPVLHFVDVNGPVQHDFRAVRKAAQTDAHQVRVLRPVSRAGRSVRTICRRLARSGIHSFNLTLLNTFPQLLISPLFW